MELEADVSVRGHWRIVEMDEWDLEAIDLVEPGFIEFGVDDLGQFGFIAVRGHMDCRSVDHDGHSGAEFTWAGDDDGHSVSGRGWATVRDDGSLVGHLFIHLGMDSGFRAEAAR